MNYHPPARPAMPAATKSPGRAQSATEATSGERRDAAQLLLWTINEWSKNKQAQEAAATGRRGKLQRMRAKAHEDEKSLCHSDWSTELCLDQSYDSIFLQIEEANEEAETSFEFVGKSLSIIGNTLMVTVFLGMFLALPVAMISIGVKYLNECPKEPKLPIYLLVGGCFGLLKVMSLMWRQVRSRRYEKLDDVYRPDEDGGDVPASKSSRFSDAVLSLFLLVWFACGNFWTFAIWRPHFIQLLHEPSNWCDETVYMFTFVQILICYGIAAFVLMIAGILLLCHRCCLEKS